MTVRELAAAFDGLYSPVLSAEWDNDGLLVSPDPDREVLRVLAVLDVTAEVLEIAERNGFDTIVAHHPLIFRKLGSVVLGDGVGGLVARALGAGISVLAYHTRADAAEGGTGDLLARLIGLTDVRPYADGIPRIGRLVSPMPTEALVASIKRATGAPSVSLCGADRIVSSVALCPGSGSDYAEEASLLGADLYLSGELGYHALLSAPELGLGMLAIGHDYSEMQIVGAFAAAVRRFCPGAKVTELAHYSRRVL